MRRVRSGVAGREDTANPRSSSSYWNTSSIEQLVLVDSLERHVTSYVRDTDGIWQPETSISQADLLLVPVKIRMSLDKIYQNTSLA
jgi:hypothetical protein